MHRAHLVFWLGLLAACNGGAKDTDPVDTDDTNVDDTDVPGETGDDDTDVDDTDVPPPFAYYEGSPVPGAWGEGFVQPGFVGESAARVQALARLADGSLVAGGIFSFVTDEPIDNIAVYDEAAGTWSALGGGLDFYVEDLLTLDDGRVLAVGWSSGWIGVGGRVAVLEDGAWTDLAWPDGRVYTVDLLQDGRVSIGGDFSYVDDVEAAGFAVWDGDVWSDVGGAFEPWSGATVRSVFQRDGYAFCITGSWPEIAGVEQSGIACWDGDDWHAWGHHDGEVMGVVQLASGRWMAYGGFAFWADQDFEDPVVGLSEWTGSEWTWVPELGIDGGMVATVRTLVPWGDDGYLLAGQFDGIGSYWGQGMGIVASNIAIFDGENFHAVGTGLQDTIGVYGAFVPGGYALRKESDTTFWVGGMFQRIDGIVASGLGFWDGSMMSVPFDTSRVPGIEGGGTRVAVAADGTVWAAIETAESPPHLRLFGPHGFTVDHDGPGGMVTDMFLDDGVVYVSGLLAGFGAGGECSVARYDAGQWGCVVSLPGGYVHRMASAGAGRFAIIGDFVGPDDTHGVAWFDGAQLVALGGGMEEGVELHKVTAAPDGRVFVSGYAPIPDDWRRRTYVAAFEGGAWSDYGAPLDASIHELLWYQGQLLVAGAYIRPAVDEEEPRPDPIGPIVTWDGDAWVDFGGLTFSWYDASVNTIVRHRDGLFVWGTFDDADGTPIEGGFAWYDGQAWHELGGGTDDIVTDVAVGDDEFWVVGLFQSIGGKPSFGLARWVPDAD